MFKLYPVEQYGYMLKIMNYLKTTPTLKEHDFQLLSLFTFYPKLNPYEVFQKLEKIEDGGERIAPKNVRERIERLHELGLLENIDIFDKIKKKQGMPTYYKLSEEGLFAFFLDFRMYNKISSYYWSITRLENKDITYREALTNFRRCIYRLHSDSRFFKDFLFNWISIETLMKLNESTLFIIGYYLSRCCKIIKNHINFFLFGKNENKKIDELDGYNNFVYSCYYDFTTLKNGDYLVEQDPFLEFTDKIFLLGNKKVRINRLDSNNVVVMDLKEKELVRYEYDNKKKELNIKQNRGDCEESVSIRALSAKMIEISRVFFVTVDQILNAINFNECIISIMTSKIDKSELITLGMDDRFKSYLVPLKELFNRNCNELLKKDSPYS